MTRECSKSNALNSSFGKVSTTVVPKVRATRARYTLKSARLWQSRPHSGLCTKSTGGADIISIATSMRRRAAVDRARTLTLRSSASTAATTSDRFCRSAAVAKARRIAPAKCRFSSTVNSGIVHESWRTTPTDSRYKATRAGSPSAHTCPSTGAMRPLSTSARAVADSSLRATMPWTWPAGNRPMAARTNTRDLRRRMFSEMQLRFTATLTSRNVSSTPLAS
mmetsp:Transcript_52023/g.160282  ORF Transcript_52023/g.160282 Transcript_52023/m.160282 type:complete len:222 (-) Transcript_52023:250-915(-)